MMRQCRWPKHVFLRFRYPEVTFISQMAKAQVKKAPLFFINISAVTVVNLCWLVFFGHLHQNCVPKKHLNIFIANAYHKILGKLTQVVNITNILLAVSISFWQNNTNINCKYRKAANNTFVQKSCSYNVGEFDIQGSISSSFYAQLLHQFPFTKKITHTNCEHIEAAQNTFG